MPGPQALRSFRVYGIISRQTIRRTGKADWGVFEHPFRHLHALAVQWLYTSHCRDSMDREGKGCSDT